MSEVLDKALELLEKQVKENGNLLVAASHIQDPVERVKVLDRIGKQIDRSKKIIKELK
jgi:hypothetical protein